MRITGLIFILFAFKPCNAQCWCRSSGQLNDCTPSDFRPCGNQQQSGVQSCCSEHDHCATNSICLIPGPTGPNSTGFYIAGCTDKLYSDPVCSSLCADASFGDIIFNQATGLWACCQSKDGYNSCANPTNVTFNAPPPWDLEIISGSPSLSTSSRSLLSTSSRSSLSTSNPSSLSSSKSFSFSASSSSSPSTSNPFSFSTSSSSSLLTSRTSTISTRNGFTVLNSSSPTSSQSRAILEMGISVGTILGGLGTAAICFLWLFFTRIHEYLSPAELNGAGVTQELQSNVGLIQELPTHEHLDVPGSMLGSR